MFFFCIAVQVPLIHEIIEHLPGFSMAANYRLIFVVIFSLVILAGFGMDELRYAEGVKPSCIMGIMVFLGTAAMMIHLFTLPAAAMMDYRLQRLVIFYLLLVGITALSMATRYSRKMIYWFPVLTVLLILGDVGYHGINYNTFMEKKAIFPQTPLTRFLAKQKGHFRVIGWKGCLLAGTETVYGYDSIIGYDPMKIYAYEKILTLINGSYNPIFTPEIQSLDSEWINFLGVKYIATPPGLKDDLFSSDEFDLVYDGKDGRVYMDKKSFSMAFWADKIIPVSDRDDAFNLISRDNFSPLRSTVLETRKKSSAFLAGHQNKPVVIEKTEGNEIKVRINNSSGLLVLSQVWFPGWKAYVNGNRRTIFRVNATFMGIVVFPGEKEVRLVFCPDSFKNGVWISCCSLIVCLLFGCWLVRNGHLRNGHFLSTI